MGDFFAVDVDGASHNSDKRKYSDQNRELFYRYAEINHIVIDIRKYSDIKDLEENLTEIKQDFLKQLGKYYVI